MAEYGRGAKAGAISGVVLGVITAVAYYVQFIIMDSSIRSAIRQNVAAGSALTADQVFSIVLATIVVGSFVGSIVLGVIFGIIFAAVHDKYMTSKSVAMRGIVIGLPLWLVGISFDVGYFYFGAVYMAASIVIGLIASLIYGYLLGHFFERFGSKKTSPPTPSTSTM